MIITVLFFYIHHFYLSLLILRAGDVELNPGPYQPKFPCKYCNYAAKWNQKCLQCNLCNGWYHTGCLGLPSSIYDIHVENPSLSWTCSRGCGMPQFWRWNSSLFHNSVSPTKSPATPMSSNCSSNQPSDIQTPLTNA